MASSLHRIRPLFGLFHYGNIYRPICHHFCTVPNIERKPNDQGAEVSNQNKQGGSWMGSPIASALKNQVSNPSGLVDIYNRKLEGRHISRNVEVSALWMSYAADILLNNSKAPEHKRINSRTIKGLDDGFEQLLDAFIKLPDKNLASGPLVLTLAQAVVTYETACINLGQSVCPQLPECLSKVYDFLMNPAICNSFVPGIANRIVQFSNMHQTVCNRSDQATNVQQYLDSILIRLFLSSESGFVSIAALSSISKYAKTPEKWSEIVETRVQSFANDLGQFDLVNLVEAMAKKGIRNPSLLRYICQFISSEEKHVQPFAIKRITSIISACRSLTFHDQTLFRTLSADIVNQLPLVTSPKFVAALLTEISLWSWHPANVLNNALTWIQRNLHSFAAPEIASVLASFGRISFIPQNSNLLLKMRNEILEKDESYPLPPVLRLEFATACAILGILNEDVVNKFVLNAENTENKNAAHRHTVSLIKKLNILSAAHFDLKMKIDDLMGTLSNSIDSTKLIEFFTTGKIAAEKQLTLIRAISPLAPPDTHMKRARILPQGVYIDCELRLDSAGHVVAVADWNDNSDELSKVAMIVRTYHDYCQTTDDSLSDNQALILTGSNYLAKKLLQVLDYKVVEINIQDLEPRKKLTDRLSIIDSKIKGVLKMEEGQNE